jgi:hypothetical protein
VLRKSLLNFPLSLLATEFTVSLLWHPRIGGQPIAGCVDVCAAFARWSAERLDVRQTMAKTDK